MENSLIIAHLTLALIHFLFGLGGPKMDWRNAGLSFAHSILDWFALVVLTGLIQIASH